jgi:putative peptidoglycan lipid II flippase
MAVGTVFSRLSGVIRTALLATALGLGVHADAFNIANTVPNMLYILVAGGVFNAVLVPQLVRAMKHDEDGGDAYVSRIFTVGTLFLLVVTVLLVAAAPLLAELFLDSTWDAPEVAAERESAIAFFRYCLPQVFFYGMFVLVGQVLNSRGRFGPMMWAPIANNVVAVGVLVTYLLVHGPGSSGGFSTGEELLLGLGSTAGIAVQLLVLLPYLARTGVRLRPRFDLRGSGLGHTLRLGWWTVLFVVVNQLAYTVVVNLGSAGSAAGGTGFTIYSTAFLVALVPHSVITVSLATAMLPRLSSAAAEDDLQELGRGLVSTLRVTLTAMLPFAVLLPVVAEDLAAVVLGYGGAADDYTLLTTPLSLFGTGILFFTVHYLVLRGFYALEATRTVFLVQCVVAAVNVTLAIALTRAVDPIDTASALVAAYVAAYAVGVVLSTLVLSRRLGGLPLRGVAGLLGRLLVALVPAVLAAYAVSRGLHAWLGEAPGKPASLLVAVAAGLVGTGLVLALSRPLRITEVTDLVSTVTGRLTRRRAAQRGD